MFGRKVLSSSSEREFPSKEFLFLAQFTVTSHKTVFLKVRSVQVTHPVYTESVKLCTLLLLLLLLLLTVIGLSPGGSGCFTCIQNMKLVTN